MRRATAPPWEKPARTIAVVQLTDAELADWPERYQRECLEPLGVHVDARSVAEGSPIRAQFHCVATTPDGLETSIDHFLLRLPRRR